MNSSQLYKIFSWAIPMLFAALITRGQEVFELPTASLVTKFPFRIYSGGVMVIKAKLQGAADSLNFVLDTGSGGISLDSSTCAEFNIPTTPTDTTIKGIGGVRRVHFVFNRTLDFTGLQLTGMNFHINNYEVLTSVYGEKIDGIIGYSFFSRYIVHIDFDSLLISVFTPGKISYNVKGYTLKPLFTSLPILPLQIKDAHRQNHHFYFDTGAGLCFLLSEKFAKDSAILHRKRKPRLTQAEGMTGRLQMRLTILRSIRIGPYSFHNVPTYLYKDDYNVTGYPFTGGLIGNELLRRFNLTINYPAREIHLSPNTHFNDIFDYTYTGLGIYYIDGVIEVVDVIPDSPASRAGFLAGDMVIGVDNNMSGNIQQYKTILQNANRIIPVIIRRDSVLMKLTLKTETIR